jgi:general secretion pathway protein E
MVNGRLRVACANPYDIEGIDSFRRIAGRDIELVVASEPDILKAITEFYGLRHSVKKAERDLTSGIDLGNLEQLVRMKSESEIESSDQHVVNAVEFMLQHAFECRASDIHIEPKREDSLIRFRIDGVLHDIQKMPKIVHAAVTSRIKTMSRLDIAEKRRPQDGRVKTTKGGRDVELRVSTLPVAFGEKVVMRIFDPEVLMRDFKDLGFTQEEHELWQNLVKQPGGILLVTGPTGSGKTTTLYTTLKQIATPEVNVCTIEDPIEMIDPRLNQMQVQPEIDLTFANGVRALMRQDPDIIMVGEIRDFETADMAIQAALTGHLVLSTLHTNDAPSSITRLLDLGAPAYLLNSTLLGIMAQRLVRTLCPHCKEKVPFNREEEHRLWHSVCAPFKAPPPAEVYRPVGCLECRNTGYMGRIGIYEIMQITRDIKRLITTDTDLAALTQAAYKSGMRPLRVSGATKVAQGITTFEEVLKSAPLP